MLKDGVYTPLEKKKRQNISTHVSGYKKGKKKSEAIVGFEGAKISCWKREMCGILSLPEDFIGPN